MADHSHLDARYFVDQYKYNCPFCNRRHVSYHIYDHVQFNWTDKKICKCFFVRCDSCGGRSLHLTFVPLETHSLAGSGYRFTFAEEVDVGAVLEAAFFYSVPTSFFALDERIPKQLRELLVEAEGCLKSNFLTGASACARKIIYELSQLRGGEGDNYEDRIKSLKATHPEVDGAFFDTLLTIQQVTSSKVHENAYDGWEGKHLRIILAALAEVLHEIYVVPALRADRRKAVIGLRDELMGAKPTEPQPAQTEAAPAEKPAQPAEPRRK